MCCTANYSSLLRFLLEFDEIILKEHIVCQAFFIFLQKIAK